MSSEIFKTDLYLVKVKSLVQENNTVETVLLEKKCRYVSSPKLTLIQSMGKNNIPLMNVKKALFFIF